MAIKLIRKQPINQWEYNEEKKLWLRNDEQSTTKEIRISYAETKQKAMGIIELYRRYHLNIEERSELGTIIKESIQLADYFYSGHTALITQSMEQSCSELNRYADGILAIRESKNDSKIGYLKALTNKLYLRTKKDSLGKNLLWELYLLSRLQKSGLSVDLAEPDLVINDPEIGVACKNKYSKNNFGQVISKSIRQICSRYPYGIVAISIDNLLPGRVLTVNDESEARIRIDYEIRNFIIDNQDKIQKYFEEDKLAAIIVSAICTVMLKTPITARRVSGEQLFIWTHPKLNQGIQDKMNKLRKHLIS